MNIFQKNSKKIFIVFALFAIYFLVSYGLYQYRLLSNSNIYIENNIAADEPVGEITEGTQISQQIPVKFNISEVSLLFATYQRINSGVLDIEIVGDQSGTVYSVFSIDTSTMADNSYVAIPLNKVVEHKNDTSISINITANSLPGNAVTIWRSSRDTVPNAQLTINGQAVQGDLVYTIAMSSVTSPYWNIGHLVPLFFIVVFVFSYSKYIKPRWEQFINNKNEASLYIILFLLGMILLFFRSAYNFIVPSMYTEDGVWISSIINNGLTYTLFHARSDYLVFGNILLLQLSLSLNELFNGNNIVYLHIFVAIVQYVFFCICAILPVWCFKNDIPKVLRILLWLLIMLVPVGGTGFEIWGKISNTGYMFYFIAFCLLYRRIFYGDISSKLSIILSDISLFICCGTHEGVYVLVLAGFILDTILQFCSKNMKSLKISKKLKNWFLVFRNRSWIILGFFCALIALYDLFVLTGVQSYPDTANINNTIELLGRLVLFYFTFPFYHYLNNKIMIVVLLIIVIWITFICWKIRKEKTKLSEFLFCLLTAIFYGMVAFIARNNVLSGNLNNYMTTAPDRFYYAINISFLIPIFYSFSIALKSKIRILRYSVIFVLSCLLSFPIVNYQYIFNYDDPQTTTTHQISFSNRIANAEFDENTELYEVQVDPVGWHDSNMQLPEDIIVASMSQ